MAWKLLTIESFLTIKASNIQRKQLKTLGVSFKLSKNLTIVEADTLIKTLKE